MAISALHAAATGLRALSTRIDVIANNLANAETTAFEDLYYTALKQPGTQTAAGDSSPAGIYVGLGVKISNTQLDTEQGPMENTGRQLDVGIQGQGFFKVKILPTISDGFGYTRNGNFFVNKDGDLVLGMGDGYKLDPKINIPKGTTDVSISNDGKISVTKAGTNAPVDIGQLEIYQFINPQGLNLLGGSIYTRTDSSGPALQSKPGEQGAGQMLQGYLESSNVDPVKELVTLIKTQRAFELNSQSIQTADQALQTIGNLRRQ
jgi:flagellar basal-body rod protein FlgG